MESEEPARVLCVDDDVNLLDGLSRSLSLNYDVSTAVGGPAGLELLAKKGPFAVVISDMRMPEMDGATFLGKVREASPESVRILLTGQADLNSAVDAINKGQIFRFLTKPCGSSALSETIEAALEQYRLVVSQRVLLEQTLHGSIKTLVDVLSLASPRAFGRATRIKRHVSLMLDRAGVRERWFVEVAAMLSQIPCITLPPDTIERFYSGATLSKTEQDMVDKLPALAEELFSHIPRLGPVLEILKQQRAPLEPNEGPEKSKVVPIGARALRIALDFDTLRARGLPADVALEKMQRETATYDRDLLQLFTAADAEDRAATVVRHLSLREVKAGMILANDVRTRTGMLLVPAGNEVTAPLLQRLTNFASGVGLHEPIAISGSPER